MSPKGRKGSRRALILLVELAVSGWVLAAAEVVADDLGDVVRDWDGDAGWWRHDADLNRGRAGAEAVYLHKGAAREVDDTSRPGLGAIIVDATDDDAAIAKVFDLQIAATREGPGGAGDGVWLWQT